jgi:hypothetical protein
MLVTAFHSPATVSAILGAHSRVNAPSLLLRFPALRFRCPPMPALGAKLAADFPTLFSTASGVIGLVAGPSSALPLLDFE